MSSPVGDLYNQLTELQKSIDNKSPFHKSLTQFSDNFWGTIDTSNNISNLCELYNLLNNATNTEHFIQKKHRKMLEETNVTLLTVIREKLLQQKLKYPAIIKKPKPIPNKNNKLSFAGLAFLGTIFAGLNGAAVIHSIIGAFVPATSLPAIVLIPAQLLFATIAVLAFYLLELNTIGKSLGIRALELGRVFKLYAKQSSLFHECFSLIQNGLSEHIKEERFKDLTRSFDSLRKAYSNFDHKIQDAKNTQTKNSRAKSIVQPVTTGVAAVVVGVLTAFAVQPLVAAMLPIIIGTALATGPIGIGITIGILGLCFVSAAILYVRLEKKAIYEIVNKTLGIPSKAINTLFKKDVEIQHCNENTRNIIKTKNDYYKVEAENRNLKNEARFEKLKEVNQVTPSVQGSLSPLGFLSRKKKENMQEDKTEDFIYKPS